MNVFARILTVAVLLALSACIEIKDFGAYWSSATLDPALAGSWQSLATDPTNKAYGKTYGTTVVDGSYEVAVPDTASGKILHWRFRSLQAGANQLLLNHFDGSTAGGMVMRYEVVTEGDSTILKLYAVEAEPFRQLVINHYSEIEKITKAAAASRGDPTSVENAQKMFKGVKDGENEHVMVVNGNMVLKQLDDATFSLLTTIPADSRYWKLFDQYKKIN